MNLKGLHRTDFMMKKVGTMITFQFCFSLNHQHESPHLSTNTSTTICVLGGSSESHHSLGKCSRLNPSFTRMFNGNHGKSLQMQVSAKSLGASLALKDQLV